MGLLREKFKTFPFIRFTNWKQVCCYYRHDHYSLIVSIHTLHELEASLMQRELRYYLQEDVSIHTLHELEASRALADLVSKKVFPFIRFTNWKQVARKLNPLSNPLGFHSYASRIGSKLSDRDAGVEELAKFPFIRFTNWKQVCFFRLIGQHSWFPFIRFTNWKQATRRP